MDTFLISDIIISSKQTKKCPSCKLERDVYDFRGIRKLGTTKCINCNLRAIKYAKKKYVPTGQLRGRPFKNPLDS